MNNNYVDDLNGFEMFLEQSCGSKRVEGTFFDGEDFYDVYGDILGDALDLGGADWRSDQFLTIIDGGQILAGDMSYRAQDPVKVLFRAQPHR